MHLCRFSSVVKGCSRSPRRLGWRLALGLVLGLVAGFRPAPVVAFSCFSDLGIVRDVDPEHLVKQARLVAQRLKESGAPLDVWELENLDFAFTPPLAPSTVTAIQQVLDAHCLISLSVSVEGEIKATAGPALAYVPTGGWGTFLIKVDNLSRQIAQLHVDSPNAIGSGAVPTRDQWVDFKLWPAPAVFSGERVDYFLVSVRGRDSGHREAAFTFSTPLRPPQSPSLLTYNRLAVLFTVMNGRDVAKARLAHLLRHQHNAGYWAALNRRGPPLVLIRSTACLECHDAANTAVATVPARVQKEQSCIACHRELAPPPVSDRCPVCGMKNCRMGCVKRDQTATGQTVALMSGIPRWLFLGGVSAVLVVSFVLVEVLDRKRRADAEPRRWNLLSSQFVAGCLRRPWFRPAVQVPVFGMFALLIYAGLAGDPVVNLTPVATWTVWWTGLIFLVLFLGKAWCFVCPWDFAATLAQSLGRLRPGGRPLTLGWRWPAQMRNIHLAIGLFVLLTWLELGYQVTASPRATAVLALGIVVLSVVPALIFEKRSFCRYGCMVGRISGLYALFAPVEIRPANPAVCRECRTRDCYHGTATVPACPTSLLVPALKVNTYCVQCGHCVRSCPHQNVAINLRPFAADLVGPARPRADEAILAILLLALTSFHGLTMTPFWDSATGFSVIGWLRGQVGAGPLTAFSLGMGGVMAAPVLAYWALCAGTRRLVGNGAVTTRALFLQFAFSLLPIALFYHLAHNAMHFFMEAQFLLPLLSDPLGQGANLFGTAAWRPGPLLSGRGIWMLQASLVVTGHLFGILIAHHAAHRLYAEPRQARLSLVPMLAGMVVYSWFSLWILHLDMNMRTTLM